MILIVRIRFSLHGLLSTLLLRERFSSLCAVLLSRGDDCMYVKRGARDDCETARLNTVLQSFDDTRDVCSIAGIDEHMTVAQRSTMSARDDSVLLLHTFSCCAEWGRGVDFECATDAEKMGFDFECGGERLGWL